MDPNQQQPIQSQQVSQPGPVSAPKSSSHKTLIIIFVAGAMLLLLLAGGYYLFMQQQTNQSAPSYTQQTTISPTVTQEPVNTDVQSIQKIDTGQNGIESDLNDVKKDLQQL